MFFHEMCRVPALAQLLPAPVWPNTKLSGRKSWPKGPARTLSMVPAWCGRCVFDPSVMETSNQTGQTTAIHIQR